MAAELETTTHNNQSPSNSQSSSTHPPPPSSQPQKEEAVKQEFTAMDSADGPSRPDVKPHISHSLQCFTADEISKYDKYEADFSSYLRRKYFSGKDVYGGDIFDISVTVGNEVIKASRWSPTRSFADPAQSFLDSRSVSASREERPSASEAGASPIIANGSITPIKKSS